MFKVFGKRAGKCRFCGKPKDGVLVQFDDPGFPPGKYCWTDLKKITELKSAPEEREREATGDEEQELFHAPRVNGDAVAP